MILKLRYPILLIILSILFYSCEKEYSLEGNVVGGTAVFTFTGAPGTCATAVVTGTYEAGVALGATNIVTIAVDVTAIGSYTISTASVNGITFKGSGSFTATGTQNITLTGSGIPVVSGTFSFTPGTNGCVFPVTVSNGGSTCGGTAVFAADGGSGVCTGAITAGTYAAGTALGSANTVSVSVNVTTAGTYTISTNTVNGISFSATGTFAATGTQIVKLTGTGTPVVGGSFNYTLCNNGCTFSITVAGSGSGSSAFTYEGAPSTCSSAIASGEYFVGTALTALNTVTIDVIVTTIGTWVVSTPVVNGFSFAGSGNFTTTGPQTVTLTGTGTPAAEGVFNFTPSNNGCAFPITVLTGTATNDFLKCTIDGVARTFNVDVVGISAVASTFVLGGNETSAANTPTFEIDLVRSPDITAGTYNKFSATNTSAYCAVTFNDGVTVAPWFIGVVETGGFSVIVTSFTANRIEGTFSGTLYDNNGLGSNAKVITAGQFSVPF